MKIYPVGVEFHGDLWMHINNSC